jgi:signal peptidase I
MKPNGARTVRAVFVTCVVFIPLALLVVARLFILQPFYVPTGAMQPTLMGKTKLPDGSEKSGDHVLVEKVSLRFRAPARGDIVVFRTKGIAHAAVPQDQVYIKRVVGLPGDRVQFRQTGLFVNGQLLTNPPAFATIQARANGHSGYYPLGMFAGKEAAEWVVGQKECFVAGDNSRNSLDSRFFGPIRREQVFGRAFFIYWPPERMGFPK